MPETFKVIRFAVRSHNNSAAARTLLFRAANDCSGSVAMMFGLLVVILTGMVGAGVDYGRWASAQNATQRALDSAVLAAGRVLQLPGKTESDAIQAATDYYNLNKSPYLTTSTVAFGSANGQTQFTGSVQAAVRTIMLGVVGIPEIPLNKQATATLAVGANAGSDVEIAMMLDSTGSMAGDKIDSLKAAAVDLVKIVVWDDQSAYTSRVALVPFANYVNVSTDYFQAVTGSSPWGTGNDRTCVKEREGAARYTDDAPNSMNGYFEAYTGWGSCKPASAIVPLTSNKSQLETAINAMTATGSTAGHLGTAWAWYTLSPKFASVWPAQSTPKSYALTQEPNKSGLPKLYKFAILMTDGEYNTKYSGDSSATQARATCGAMKAAGVTVYTVGFAIASGGEADQTLQQCATSSAHYFSADDGNALKGAFRAIALQIATLRISG